MKGILTALGVIAIFAGYFNYAKAQTNVINLDNPNSPYFINGEFVVEKNSQLIISSDVQIKSAGQVPANIKVFGSLSADSSAKPISLENIKIILEPGSTLRLHNTQIIGSITADNAQIELSEISITDPNMAMSVSNSTHFLIENSRIISQIGINLLNVSDFYIKHNDFFKNSTGIIVDSSSGSIDYNNFELEGDYTGIHQKATNIVSAKLNYFSCFAYQEELACPRIIGEINDFTTVAHRVVHQLRQNELIISELYPNPPVEPSQEWIEIYNPLDYAFTVFDLKLADNNKLTTIPIITFLPKQYLVISTGQEIYKEFPNLNPENVYILNSTIGNGLNNTGENISLIHGKLVLSDNIINSIAYSSSKEGKSYSLLGKKFLWNTPTPGGENIEYPLIEPSKPNITMPTNSLSCPSRKIKISELPNYLNCRVELEAQVKKSYGTYFFIKDESGEAKVYLQASRKISKPRLYSGSLVIVRGIVDNYRTGLRILPEKTSDIELLPTTKSIPDDKNSIKNTSVNNTQTVDATPKTTIESFFPDNLLNEDNPAVKGSYTDKQIIAKEYWALKICLLFAIMVFIALQTYKLGLKHGSNNQQF